MREILGDPWTWDEEPVLARVVPISGERKKDGHADMSGLAARDALKRFGPRFADELGARLQQFGEHNIQAFRPQGQRPYWIVALPVKHEGTTTVHQIRAAAAQLHAWCCTMLEFDYEGVVVLQRPSGIGWAVARKALSEALDQEVLLAGKDDPVSLGDQFVVVS